MAAHHRKFNAVLPIRFFKIILKTNLKMIKIPNKFTMKYGSSLPNPLFIRPPDGSEWKVYWATQNGEVWLKKGWKQFVQHYSLDEGYIIFFQYQGTPHINVLIHDQSALEIAYPYSHEKDDDKLDHTVEEWYDRKCEQIKDEKPIRRISSLNWPIQTRAREIASNFISTNPFFTVFLKPAHVADSHLSIPDLKGITIGKKEKNVHVTLQHGGRSWDVKLRTNDKSFSYGRLSAGWSLFASEAKLEPRDVCIFELISIEDPVIFKILVFNRQD